MAIIQATVPTTNLATQIGVPNVLDVEYSTNILLPVPGPMLIFWVKRGFLRALMAVNEFLVFAENASEYIGAARSLNLEFNKQHFRLTGLKARTRFDRTVRVAAIEALVELTGSSHEQMANRRSKAQRISQSEWDAVRVDLLERLAAANFVFREALDAGLLVDSNQLFGEEFARAKSFDKRAQLTLQALLATRKRLIPRQINADVRAMAEEVLSAADRFPTFLVEEFDGLAEETRGLLVKWMVSYYRGSMRPLTPLPSEYKNILGFPPVFWSPEWAFRRQERLAMQFGTPDLRGPVVADALPPQGEFMREDYQASTEEMTTLAAERREITTREQTVLNTGYLQRRLSTVYYAGPGDVNQLTSQATTSAINEQIRNNVLAMLREVSEARENMRVDVSRREAATTVRQISRGIDSKLSATHHRFKVVVPVTNTVYLRDVGLTWCPRITNPFLPLRVAARRAWEEAYNSYRLQYYVPEPVRPHLVWERIDIKIDVSMDGEEWASDTFRYTLAATDREERPDFDNASVVWEQNESLFNDDPDYWTIWLSNLRFSGGTISGRVTTETGDGGADFEGTARIVIPILRYSQETVNNLAEYEAALSDYNLKLQALRAQAGQYANIKQREFIESHAAHDAISKVLMEALVKRSCASTFASDLSYFREIISRCVDWESTRIEFESAPINELFYPEYPSDHFMNSRAVRFFLPIFRDAEDVLFDVLQRCGSFFMRSSVEYARDRIAHTRAEIQEAGPQELLAFDASLVIGEHVEAVMSNHDLAS